MALLATLDFVFVTHACHSIMTRGASVQLVFGFEYAILMTMVLTTFIKYFLHTLDLQNDNPWENKAVYMLYTELFTGTERSRPYPDATPEELQATDNVCIICREEMLMGAKRLPCNHIFHSSCLRSWFQRQQTCPTCRMDVLRAALPNQTQAPPPAQQPAPPPPQHQPAPPPANSGELEGAVGFSPPPPDSTTVGAEEEEEEEGEEEGVPSTAELRRRRLRKLETTAPPAEH
ncbi:UNVERIFIED_CONTAM: hypothetical protein FKN15_016802 [Acipenser sinensis]